MQSADLLAVGSKGCLQGGNPVGYLQEDKVSGPAVLFGKESDLLPLSWCCLGWCCHGQILGGTTDSGWPWYFPALSL